MSRLCAFGVVAVCLLVSGCSGKGKATKANFEKVKEGMSVKEVEDLMGGAKESVSLDMKEMLGGLGGLPGMGELGAALPKMTVKVWEDGDNAYEVIFKDDKVQAKASGNKEELKKKREKDQGTKPAGNKVSKENYEKLKNGMSKAEVEALLGAGKAKVGGGIEGIEGDAFVYEGDDKVITVVFVEGKVVGKAHASK